MNNTENNTPAPEQAPAQTPAPTPAPASAPAAKPALASLTASLDAISEKISGFISKLVSCATRALTPDCVRCATGWSRVIGNYAVLAGIALTIIHSIVLAARLRHFALVVVGVLFALGILLAHYVAGRFMASSDKIIEGTPGRVSSMAFLECLGLFMLLGAIGALGMGIYMAIDLSSIAPLITAIVAVPLIALAAAITLNPATLGITQGDASAGEEALGLLSFALKIWLKLVPPLFCLLALAGCLVMVWGFFNPNAASLGLSGISGAAPLPFIQYFVMIGMASGMAGPAMVLYACMTPVIVYLSFILLSLGIDLMRAVLAIPGKLDELKK